MVYFSDSYTKQVQCLLATLPYGIQRYDALDTLFNFNSAAKAACIRRMEQVGYLQKKKLNIKSAYRSYLLTYITITELGVAYLADHCSNEFPWLPALAHSISKLDSSLQVRGGMSSQRMERLLRSHAVSLYLSRMSSESRSPIETIYERLLDSPIQIAQILCHGQEGKMSERFFPQLLSTAISAWHRSSIPPHRRSSDTPIRFFDVREMSTIGSYSKTENKQISTFQDPAFYGSEIGIILNGSHGLFPVYATSRDGLKWSNCQQDRQSGRLRQIGVHLGYDPAIGFPSRGYRSIVFCMRPEEMERAVKDGHGLRRSRDKVLGRDHIGLHLLPVPDTSEKSVKVYDLLLHIISDASCERAMNTYLRKQFGHLLDATPFCDEIASFRYHGRPLINGTTMHTLAITRCYEDPDRWPQIICFRWQAQYYRSILPRHVHIFFPVCRKGGYSIREYIGNGVNDWRHHGCIDAPT